MPVNDQLSPPWWVPYYTDGFLLHSSKDLAAGWKLVSSFMREIEVMHLGLFFDILADGCIMGGGVGYGMRKLSPIHINKPSNAYL
jgi:hypothetical protein